MIIQASATNGASLVGKMILVQFPMTSLEVNDQGKNNHSREIWQTPLQPSDHS